MSSNPLMEAFKQAEFRLGGHGTRSVQVLKDALDGLDGAMESDMYGKGEIIEAFQAKMAALLGKEEAVFFPSGTMAQQIALRIWCDRSNLPKIAYHPLSHLELHEEDALRRLHHIEPVLIGDRTRPVGLQDVLDLQDEVAAILLELPQREIGGQLPPYNELEAISVHCRSRGIKLHLDGARLFETLPYYKKTEEEVCRLFDSVYISFYKGIGGIAGAILAGESSFIGESKVWKRRHGGDLISLYPYIISADHFFDHRVGRMEEYVRGAVELAEWYNGVEGIRTLPTIPVTNMFHVHVEAPKERMEQLLADLYKDTGIGLTHYLKETGKASCFFEVSIGDAYSHVPRDRIRSALQELDHGLKSMHR